MIYNPYNIVTQTYNSDPYKIDNSTNTGYNVSTYNVNKTNG